MVKKLKFVTLMERWKYGSFPTGTEMYKFDKCNFILEGISVRGYDYTNGFFNLEDAEKEILKIKENNPSVKINIDLEDMKNYNKLSEGFK